MATSFLENSPEDSRILVEAPQSGSIAFPNGDDLFGGEFARDGYHLAITGVDGQQYLIKDYFLSATPSDFEAPNGALLSGHHATMLAGPRMPGFAQAASQAASALANQAIGVIKTLEGGNASALRPDGSKVALTVGSKVYEGDVVQTGAGAKLSIVFSDTTVMRLDGNSRMVLDEFAFTTPDSSSNSILFTAIEGAFSFLTGFIAPSGGMKVNTPVATMGIRGTYVVFTVDLNGGQVKISTNPDPTNNNQVSKITLYRLNTSTEVAVLEQAEVWAVVSSDGSYYVEPQTYAELQYVQSTANDIGAIKTAAINEYQQLSNTASPNTGTQQPPPDSPQIEIIDVVPDSVGEVVQVETAGDAAAYKNVAPVVVNDVATIGEDVVSVAVDVIANDRDPNGEDLSLTNNGSDGVTLTEVNFNQSANGAAINAPALDLTDNISSSGNTITFETDGDFEFLADGETATVTIPYTVTDDGQPNLSSGGLFTVTVTGSNDAPVIDAIAQTNLTETTDTSTIATTLPISVTFTDVDLSDVGHTASVASTGTSGPSGLTLSPTQLEALVTVGTVTKTAGSTAGSTELSFSAPSTDFDYLAVGESVTLSYTLTVDDGDGGSDIVPFDIQITGTNDAPVIDAIAQTNLTETTDTSTIATTLPISVTFTDVDLSDVGHTASVASTGTSGPSGLTLLPTQLEALVTVGTVTKTAGSTAGSTELSFSAPSTDFDYLAVGESVTLSYTLTVDDGDGGSDIVPFDIQITGTNDAPVIDAIAQTNLTETTDTSTIATTLPISVTFTDVDLSDVGHTASVASTGTSGPSGLNLSPTQLEALVTVGTVTKTAGSTAGSTELSFSAPSTDFDYLAVGESVTLSYTLTVDDGDGGSDIVPFDIQITGTNDAPVIDAIAQTNLTETTDTSTIATTLPISVTFTDVDLSDVGHTASVASTGTSGPSGLNLSPTQWEALVTVGTVTKTAGSTAGLTELSFSAPSTDFDYLAVGESVTLSYTLTVDDGDGGSDIVPFDIQITGSNDAPVIDAIAQTNLTETTDTSTIATTLPISVTFTDVDLSDVGHTASVASTGTSGPSGLTLSPTQLGALLTVDTVTKAPGSTAGSTTVSFSAPSTDFDYLADGEIATLNYDLTVTDSVGGSDTIPFVIQITGTNDAPVIDAIAQTNLTETTDTSTIATTSPISVTFTDVDWSDVGHTASVASSGTSGPSGLTLSPTQLGALLTVGTVTKAPGSTAGSTTVSFSAPSTDFDYLADGEIATLNYDLTVTDSVGGSDTIPFVIQITGTNDGPVASADSNVSDLVREAGVGIGNVPQFGDATATGNVLVNDTDVDNNAILEVSAVNGASGAVGNPVSGTYGNIVIAGDGSYTYTLADADPDTEALNQGDVVTDIFDVTVSDEHGVTSPSTLTITINGTNDAPTISSGLSETAMEGDALFTIDMLAGASDIDDGETATLTVANVAGLGPGITHSGTTLTVDPSDAVFNSLGVGQGLASLVTYDIVDVNGAFVPQTVIITVNGTNDGPVAVGGQVVTSEEVVLSGNLLDDNGLGASYDPDQGDTLAINTLRDSQGNLFAVGVEHTLPDTGAKLTVQSNGDFVFDPRGAFDFVAAGASSADNVRFTVIDQHGAVSGEVQTNLSVTGVNDDPIFTTPTGTVTTTLNFEGTASGNVYTENGVQITLAGPGAVPFAIADATGDGDKELQLSAGDGYVIQLTDGSTFDLDGLSLDAVSNGSFTVRPSQGTQYSTGAPATLSFPSFTGLSDVTLLGTATVDDLTITYQSPSIGGVVAEIADGASGENVDTHGISGQLTYADADSTDGHSISYTEQNGGVGYRGSFNLTNHDQTGDTFEWTFDVDDADLDDLQAGQVVTQYYDVTLSDGNGGTAVQTVEVTLNGAGDAPEVSTASFATINFQEFPANGGNVPIPQNYEGFTWSGNLEITLNASVGGLPNISQSNPWAGVGLAINRSGEYFIFEGVDIRAEGNAYTASLEGYRDGVLVASETVYVNSSSATLAQFSSEVIVDSILIHDYSYYGVSSGPKNDAARIFYDNISYGLLSGSGVTDALGAVTEDAVIAGNLNDTGTIVFDDADVADTHTTTVVADAGNTLGGTLTMGAVTQSAGTAQGTVDWTYEVANAATQHLVANETTTERFTVTIADGNGGTVEQLIEVTATGTNDAPIANDETVTYLGLSNGSVGIDTGDLLANDIAVDDGFSLKANSVTQGGTVVTLNGDGTIPATVGATPIDFGYTIIDGSGLEDMATATVVFDSELDFTATANGTADVVYGNAADNRIDGRGGNDVIYGQGGNDTIVIEDTNFAFIDGGSDMDTLEVNGALNFNLSDGGLNFETIDLKADGTGSSNSLSFSGQDLINFGGSINLDLISAAGTAVAISDQNGIVINGDSHDTVNLSNDAGGTWQQVVDGGAPETLSIGGVTDSHHVYNYTDVGTSTILATIAADATIDVNINTS